MLSLSLSTTITRNSTKFAHRSFPRVVLRHYISIHEMIFGETDTTTVPTNRTPIPAEAGKLQRYYPMSQKVRGRYISPWTHQTNKSFSDTLKLLMTRNPQHLIFPNVKTDSTKLIKTLAADRSKVRDVTKPHVSWMGHASCYFQNGGLHFLTDPVWSARASPLSFAGPKRYTEPPIEVEDLKIDVVLLSHTHYDHLDLPTAKRIGNRALW